MIMRTIDVVTSISLKTSVGPVQTIKRLIKSSEILAERGYELNVFTIDSISSTIAENIKSKPLPFKGLAKCISRFLSRQTKFYPIKRISALNKSTERIISYYLSLNRAPDVLVFHSWRDCYEYLIENQKSSIKICLFIHSDGSPEGNKMILSYYPKLRGTEVEAEMNKQLEYTLKNIDAMACITKVEEINLLKQYPFLKGKTVSVINGITDLSHNQLEYTNTIKHIPQSKKYRLISVGSMNGRKGHKEIIQAVYQMNPNLRKDVLVTFVGDGQDKDKLQSLVGRYNIADNFIFTGKVPNEEVYKYQAKANISILFSKLEGLPLALLEGLRSGIALISTNVSGIPEVVHHGENGVLINYSQQELNNIFNNLDKYDWDKMGTESRKLFDDYYNFPRMREDYIKMLEKVLN